MNTTKDNKWRDGKALERYTLIAPLLEGSLDPAKRLQMREDIASRNGISLRSLYRYEAAFKKQGFSGLRLFSVSSRRTPYGRTPLTESGLAAFPHPALCETNRSHLSIIYTDIYSGSYQWIAVIYHIQKFYPVVAFLLTPPI